MKILYVLLVLCILNFVAFGAISLAIGGDAMAGYEKQGHYYVSDHGHETEVSQGVWTYSLWHARSIVATHTIGFVTFLAIAGTWAQQRHADERNRSTNP